MKSPQFPFALLGALGFVFGGAVLGATACSATDDGSTFDGGTGASASDTSGGDPTAGAGGGIFGSSSVGAGGGNGVGGGCAGDSIKAEKVPLNLFIMLDQSGSMDDPVGGGTKWQAVTSAIGSFVNLPEAAGIGVGIQYFGLPPGGMGCPLMCAVEADCMGCGPCFFGVCLGAVETDSCNAADYATAAVPIAPLPGVAQAIVNSMAQHSPSTGTPTSAALQGAIDYATGWANANPDHVTVVVLATDGDPASCDTNLANINAIAAAGANAMPPILTFVIGVGGSAGALHGFAAAGGTQQAYIIDQNQSAQEQFLAALEDIQGKALPCAYGIPQPDSGMIDYGQVNVQYTPGTGGDPQLFPKVGSEADCPADGNAWYYDDNAAPTQIVMCPATCETIGADATGTVDVIIGCETIVP